jgi:hypothetical protein
MIISGRLFRLFLKPFILAAANRDQRSTDVISDHLINDFSINIYKLTFIKN